MDNESTNDRKRKAVVVVGAISSVIGCISTIVGLESIPRELYVNHDEERQVYLNGIINGSDRKCHNMLRMNKDSFHKLVAMCREKNLLRDTRNVSVEEQMAEFLHTIGHNVKNRLINHNFNRSGETISRYFHIVLKAILCLHKDLIKQPTNEIETPQRIRYSERFWPWFKDCVGAIDGTHVRANVPEHMRNKFYGRKEKPTQNILDAVSFDLKFTYVLAGWEGSAHDARVLEDALSRPNGLKIPEGKYYLVDAGYSNRKGFIAPFRGVRYHLKEWGDLMPSNPKELFNHRHSALRNTVERAFGVLKKRWKILDDSECYFAYDTQVDVVLACCILHNHIMGVNPNDTFLSEVDRDLELQNIPNETPRSRLTRKEQREANQECASFRMKIANDMWNSR